MAGGKPVVIIGGGAAGLCAGVLCARAGLSVTLLEKTENCGRKLSMTGNGRCNLSNLAMDAACYNEEAVPLTKRLLARYGVEETIAFFREAGILLRSEEGWIYPVSGSARQVAQALTDTFLTLGGQIVYHAQVKRILQGPPFQVRTAGASFAADVVVLATGGLSGPKKTAPTGDGYYIAEHLGMVVTARYPALVRLLSDDDTLPADAGVRVKARALFLADRDLFASEYGEVQITGQGLSGIPVMQASDRAARALDQGQRVQVRLDLFPDTAEAAWQALKQELCAKKHLTLAQLMNGMTDSRVGGILFKRTGYAPEMTVGELGQEACGLFLDSLRALDIAITGTAGFQQAQATAGGIALHSLSDTLESVTTPGVYCIGELVDVNGRCGGYNLQWAWTGALCVADDIISGYDQNHAD